MFMTIALLCLLCLLLALILLRSPPAVSPPPHLIPVPPPRHVSFSLVSSDTSYALPAHRRWSSPFHKRKSSPPDSPDIPVDQFGRILTSSPASESLPSPKPSTRLSTSLHLSFTGKRRSSSVSCTSTLIHLDQVDARPSLPSTPAARSPPQRARFVNPFSKHSRSRTLSPPSTYKSLDTPLSSPSSPPPRRRTLVNKFKSIFKSTSPEPNPITQPKPTTTNTRLRRKPVARTQPYGPPWNAPMPVPDFTLSQHPLRESAHQSFRPERTTMSPGQLSPRTFITELDEKLSLLHQQRIRDSIPSCSFI